jgi:hypothetical protein
MNNLDLILNESVVKNSFDRMIQSFNNPQTDNTYKNTQQKSNIKNENNNIFCNNNCKNKFNTILKKMKEGKVDFTKIDWANIADFNLVQNLVNYYYNQGLIDGSKNEKIFENK